MPIAMTSCCTGYLLLPGLWAVPSGDQIVAGLQVPDAYNSWHSHLSAVQAADSSWRILPTDLERVLRRCSIERFPTVFQLAYGERRITFHSQQIRAFNLVNALKQQAQCGVSILVAGGGIAGVSSAAGLALLGAHVNLVERSSQLLSMQRNSAKRLFHPNIYDWPTEDSLAARTSLPMLNWRAAGAKCVVEQIDPNRRKLRSHIFKAPHYGQDFRFLQNAVGFFGSQQDSLCEFRARHDSPL